MTHLRPLTPNPCNLNHRSSPKKYTDRFVYLWLEFYSHTTAPYGLRRKETILEIPLVEDVLNAAE